MLPGETLTEFTNLFSPNKYNFKLFYDQCLKMPECNSHNMYPNLGANTSNEKQFRLSKINKIKAYFIAEIKERELMSKRLSKYITSFDYFDKSLFYL